MSQISLQVECQADHYILKFNSYVPELVAFCKALQAARYYAHTRVWVAARSLPNALELHAAGYYHDKMLLDDVKTPIRRGNYLWQIITPPYKHQTDWQTWSTDRGRAICTAQMGLGKTRMATQWLANLGVAPEKVLAVVPATLVPTFATEICKHTGVMPTAIVGDAKRKAQLADEKNFHVVSYDSYGRMQDKFKDKEAVIADEFHFVKNPGTERSKTIFNLSKKVPYFLGLTGTPITQGAQDYYSQIRCIDSKLLGPSYTSFKKRYCLEEQVRGAPWGIKRIVGYQKLDELTRIVSGCVRTYLKKDCLDLPEKTYQTRYIELTPAQQKVYRELKYEMAATIGDTTLDAPHMISRLVRFSQITQGFIPTTATEGSELHMFDTNPKLNELKEIVDDLKNEPFIIMCRFLEDIKNASQVVQERGIPFARIYGAIPPVERQKVVADFQEGKIQALVCQIATAGVGFTFTKAQTMVFYSNSFSYTDRVQAEDRIHRIGQLGTCLYIDIVAQGTIDELIQDALHNKKGMSEMLADLRTHFQDK